MITSLVRNVSAVRIFLRSDLDETILHAMLSVIFNPTMGVIFPMVIIPWVSYFFWLVLFYPERVHTFIWLEMMPVMSTITPLLCLVLILSDWMPTKKAPFDDLLRCLIRMLALKERKLNTPIVVDWQASRAFLEPNIDTVFKVW